jgi:membrane protease YdiL (CAAX protease family)
MAFVASKKISYWGQLGLLTALTGAGLVIGGIASLIPIMTKMDLSELHGLSSREIMNSLLVPENAGLLRVMQFITTFFLFFLPPVIYAWICHNKAFTHLGYKHKITAPQFFVVIFIMISALPLVGVLSQLTEMLPFSKATFEKFKAAEDAYNRQVSVIGRMNNLGDYFVALFILAILPAVFEETLFRGGLQNLLSRWWKAPVLSIIVTAIIFSIAHGSYLGFLSRLVLGIILGWMYYRTGNIWLNIIAHAANNTVALTGLYLMKLKDQNVDLSNADIKFSLLLALPSLIAVIFLFILFERVSKFQIDRPGQEVVLQESGYNQPPWAIKEDQ